MTLKSSLEVTQVIETGDMEGIPEYKVGAADLPRRPLAVKLLYVCYIFIPGVVRVNAYKCAKFQVPSSISYRDMEGIPE